jgi:hypothetical protein
VPERAEVPVAAFTPAPGGARHEAGITGRLPRVHSQRPSDRVNASSLAESEKAICIIFVALVVGRPVTWLAHPRRRQAAPGCW